MIKHVTRSLFLIIITFGITSTKASAFQVLNQSTVESIASARAKGAGSTVTIAGRITVAGQFGGPAYMQDNTAGIAVYNTQLVDDVAIGDSVVVTGTLADYNDLLEISSNVTYQIISTPKVTVSPSVITINDVSEAYEGQLVQINAASFSTQVIFQGNTNYTIQDASGSMDLRIDIDDTALVGLQSPSGTVNIIGVIGEYKGVYQILPRFPEDVGAKPFVNPGENVPKDQTFDIVTWNLEWFGASNLGPADDSLQVQNVATVMQNLDADVYALQEVSNTSAFEHLLRLLPGYKGLEATYSQQQKTAFVYKTSTIDSLSSSLINNTEDPNFSYDWANGRLPFEFILAAHIGGITKVIYMIDVHAKASTNDPATDYSRRVAASNSLKSYMDQNMDTYPVILLGDYNDDVDVSIYNDQTSPYANFVNDSGNYKVVTKLLSNQKLASNAHGTEMIDHMTISNELFTNFFDSTQVLANTDYITNYVNTTSDHYPVYARFKFNPTLAITDNPAPQLPNRPDLQQNYPNPFNPTTNITFSLPKSEMVTLKVYNVLGQNVTTLINRRYMNRGQHLVTFNASNIPSGIYFYRLQTGSNFTMTKKMILMK